MMYKLTLFTISLLWICFTPVQAQSHIQIPYGGLVQIDGKLASSEWADADTVLIQIAGNKTVYVLYKHDSLNLNVAFYGSLESANIRFPELYLDINHDRHATWQGDDWWFHVSATDCEAQGKSAFFDNCQKIRPNWIAEPNFSPGGSTVDSIEIQIPFSTIQLNFLNTDTIGLTFNVNNSFNAYEYWPLGADINSPASWGKATFGQGPSTSIDKKIKKEELKIYPNPSNGELILSLPEGVGNEQYFLCLYNLQGALITRQSIRFNNRVHHFHQDEKLPSGTYLLRLTDNKDHFYTTKWTLY